MDNLEAVERAIGAHCMAADVARVEHGLRIQTRFQYPDGSLIDLYAIDGEPVLPESGLRLTDFGETMGWLANSQIRPARSKRRMAFLEDVLTRSGARLDGGELLIDTKANRVGEDLIALGQACVRASDLLFTRRSSMQTSFSEELEELVVDTGLDFEAPVELQGRFGLVRVDYLVQGSTSQTAVLALSTGSAQQAHISANEVFSRWYDLDIPSRREARLTVFDDRFDVYRDLDFQRLRNVSDVYPCSEVEAITKKLAA